MGCCGFRELVKLERGLDMGETTDVSIRLLVLLVVYCEKLMAAATAQGPVAMMLHEWASLELQAQGGHFDKQFMKIHSSATAISVDLNHVVLDQRKVICRLLMRVLCSGDWNINGS